MVARSKTKPPPSSDSITETGYTTTTLTFNTFNGKWCSFAPIPAGCRQNPEIYGECDENILRNATLLGFATRFLTTVLCLAGIIVCMVKICWHVMITTNTTRSTRLGNLRGQHHNVTQQTHRDEHNANAADLLVRHYRRQFFIQASLYVLAYASTHSFAWIRMVVVTKKQAPGSVFMLLNSIVYPLGGLFNILVYTRPKVLSHRRNNPEDSWFRAFILVVRAGGVVPAAVDVENENEVIQRIESYVLVRRHGGLVAQGSLQSIQESAQFLSSGGIFLNLPSSIGGTGTPPFSLTNELSSGIISYHSDPLSLRSLDSTPPSLQNTPSPADRSSSSSPSMMNTIAEEPDEEE